jgi:hypothetical protein
MKKTKNFICILSTEYIASLSDEASETSYGKREALAALTQKMNIIPIIPKGGPYPGKPTADTLVAKCICRTEYFVLEYPPTD